MAKRNTPAAMVENAGLLFSIYYAMGNDRSLERVRQEAKAYGLKTPSLTTLKHYSTRFNWQARLVALNDQASRSVNARTQQRVLDMNEQQAVIGAMGVQAAARGLERLIHHLTVAETCEACGVAPLTMEAVEISRLMDTFAKWQRMGLGEATDRREISISIWNIMIAEVVQLFLAINPNTDEEARKREMMVGFDDIVGRHVAAVAEGAT